MPPLSRAATVRGLVLAFALLLAGCKVDLYTGLEEAEANEMLAALMRARIEASRVTAQDGTSTIQVAEADIADAVELLKARGLPREKHDTLAEVFTGDGFITSETEERARFVYALGEELSRTISDIDGVLSARVHVVLPRNDPLRNTSAPSSASVFIRHDAAAAVEALLPQIKLLVANSIEGLAYDKVAVIFVPVTVEEPVRRAPAEAALAAGARQATLVPGLDWESLPLLLGAAGAALGAAAAVIALVGGRTRRQG